MRRLFAFLLFTGALAPSHAAVGVRVILGLADTKTAKWDGSATSEGGRITSVEPWRFDGDDEVLGNNSWRVSTHPIRLFGGGQQQAPQMVANGVILWLDGTGESATVQVKTAQGNFAIKLSDIPYGRTQYALDRRVMVDRLPPFTQITNSPEEQDYPAAVTGKDGTIWLAYVEFRHNKDHDRLRANLKAAPASFDDFKAPTGGDQILVRKFSQNAWSEPIAITPPGGDLYRPAIAVDGSGRPWVFWSTNQNGNFDLWARAIESEKAGRTIRLSTASGSDVNPAAATDAKGRVWVVWQGWRDGKASIFGATQQGDGFSNAAAVSSSTGNEWNPAIAADSSGKVSVAYDSYRNGNYDIYLRAASGPGAWGKETAVASSARYEAYPSMAYDPAGRLWVAYEEGGERWGKDFGAYDTQGIALYQGRAIRLRGFGKDGRAVATNTDIGTVLNGVPGQRIDDPARQGDSDDWLKPDPRNAKTRAANRPAVNYRSPKNTLPRLQCDASGRLWMAYRSAHPIWWNPLGTVWTEHVVSWDGAAWTGPIFLSHSDNLLDNRPALVSMKAGEMMVIGSSDSRRQFHALRGRGAQPLTALVDSDNGVPRDPYNNDLYSNTLTLGPAAGTPVVVSAAAIATSKPDEMSQREKTAIAAMRKFRTPDGLRLLRGEFHRHSEISMDGGSDGTIIDQWRYMLDPGGMDWVGCCDHDNGGGREYSWWTSQKLTDIFYTPGKFVPMFSYERSVAYPEGHRNVIFAQRGIRTLPRLPKMAPDSAGHAPDTQMLYGYLKAFNGIVASHTSGTNMGTDWRDNDPLAEPVVEIYQGDRQNYEMPGAPRSNSENDSIGGWRPLGFVSLALEKGYKLSFQASSDHVSTHLSYCNVLAKEATRESFLEAVQKRHVYGATDNILADFRSGGHMMGDAFSSASAPELTVKLTGTAPFSKIQVIKDNQYVYAIEPKKAAVDFTWRDNAPKAGGTSYYYVRGEQEDGNIVWVSPMWITYTGK